MSKFALLPADVQADKITFNEKVMINANNNGRTVYLAYPGSGNLVIETPWMKAPYGLSVWNNDGKAPDRHTLDMSFSSDLSSPEEIGAFKKLVEELDEFLITKFFENSSKWIKKSYKDVDVVRELYNKMYKVAKDKEGNPTDKYPATFKINMPMRDGAYACPILGSNCQPFVPTKANTQGANIKAIIKCVGIWLANGKFGCTWRLQSMMVAPKEDSSQYQFRVGAPSCGASAANVTCDEEIDDDCNSGNPPPPAKNTQVESSDEEEEGSDEEDEVEAPPPPPVKVKRVAK